MYLFYFNQESIEIAKHALPQRFSPALSLLQEACFEH
jgi:hypothetical protein